nr:restriction endonuclease [uncultured Intestinibacter sp.]
MPTYEEIMLPLLKFIYNGEIHNNKECEKELGNIFGLTEQQLAEKLGSGKRKFYDRLNWSKTYLRKAGLIEDISRGKFKITEEGKQLVDSNPSILDSKYLQKYPSFVEYLEKSKKKIESNSSQIEIKVAPTKINKKTPIEELEDSYQVINDSLKDQLLEKLKQVDCYKFEEIVLDLIIKMGYGGSKEEAKQSLTKKGNDEGIDGIINEDRLGLDRIYVQAKRWKESSVGRPEVQKFAGALDGQGETKGIFITTSKFTDSAIEYTNTLHNKKIILIDGDKLAELMMEFNVGVSVEVIYEIKRIDSDYFLED